LPTQLSEELADPDLARVVVDRLVSEYRMVDARNHLPVETAGRPPARSVIRVFSGTAGGQGPELDIPVVEAIPPYNDQIAQLDKQIGAVKDASGASQGRFSPWLDPEPRLQHETALRGKIRARAILAHQCGQGGRDMGDVGDDCARPGKHRVFRREDAVEAKFFMNQCSLAAASSSPPASAPACPTAQVNLAFQRPTTHATIGLVNSASSS
jgi:hypothetical protein